jgi:hypothetical protein
MKVYLDDKREAPQGWIRAYTPDEVIGLLKSGQVKAQRDSSMPIDQDPSR